MLTSLRIQNFRSISDASVKLGQVNLFIGPNNSGKSNFLKGIELLSHTLTGGFQNKIQKQFGELLSRKILKDKEQGTIGFQVQSSNEADEILSVIMGYQKGQYMRKVDDYVYDFNTESAIVQKTNPIHNFSEFTPGDAEDTYDSPTISKIEYEVRKQLRGLQLYKLEPTAFELSTELSDQTILEANGRNIGSFLYTLSQNQEAQFVKLKKEFADCVGTLTSLSAPPDPDKKGNLRLKFFDSAGISY